MQPIELIQLAGRYRMKEKIISGPAHMYGAIALHPLILLTGLDMQMKYILHTIFCQELMLSSNLSELKERFIT